MFELKSQLTNTRAPKSDIASVTTSPTDGIMRLSFRAAEALNVDVTDYVVLQNGELEGEKVIVIGKGHADGYGSKLGGKSSGMSFASKNAWLSLGGEDTMLHTWLLDIESPIEVKDEDGEVQATYFKLTKGESTPKSKRGDANDEVEEVEFEEKD